MSDNSYNFTKLTTINFKAADKFQIPVIRERIDSHITTDKTNKTVYKKLIEIYYVNDRRV